MKTKTATFSIYSPFQANGSILDILYRGKLLFSFHGQHEIDLMEKAKQWAINQGFNKIKYQYIVGR